MVQPSPWGREGFISTAITLGEGGIQNADGTAIFLGEEGVHRVSGTTITMGMEGSLG